MNFSEKEFFVANSTLSNKIDFSKIQFFPVFFNNIFGLKNACMDIFYNDFEVIKKKKDEKFFKF